MVNKIPSPQSVVVPVELLGRMKAQLWTVPIRSDVTLVRAMIDEALAAAPAPSSLAGGEVTNDDAPTYMRLAQALSRHPEVMVVERSDPTLELTPDSLEHLLDDVFPLAALSQEAPAREGVAELIDQIRQSEGAAVTIMCDNPDFNGQPNSAVEVVADWTNWQTVRFTGETVAEALRNARDMVGGKIMGECSTLARVQLEQALTPRHEAPASPAWRDEYNRVEAIREAAEGQDRIARSTADPIAKSDAETQAAGHWTRYEREVAKLNAASGHEAPADQIERWAKALFDNNTFYAPDHGDDDGGWSDMAPNDGGSHDLHMDMARAAKSVWDRADEAPAEGAGEAMTEREVRQWIDACNHEPARQVLRDYLALRARSSAPEAREEALGNLLAVIHGDGGHRALEVGTKQAALEAEKIVARLLSSAPEARDGEAVAWRWRFTADAYGVDGATPGEWKYQEAREQVSAVGQRRVEQQPLYTHPAAPSADKLREVLRDLMDMEFAKDWRTWSEDRATRLLGIGPRLNAFLAAREAALKAAGA